MNDEIFENAYDNVSEVKDGVDSAIDTTDSIIENTNTTVNISKYVYDYYDAESDKDKKYAISALFGTALGVGDKIPDTYGGWTMGISYYVYNIASEEALKETIRNEIKKEMMKISASPFYNDPTGEKMEHLQHMLEDIDSVYADQKKAYEEYCKENDTTAQSNWDMFYDNYQKNNDPDEIIDKINSWFDKKAEELGLYDNTTPQGSITEKWSEFLCLDIPNAYKTWDTFWKGCGASFHHYWNDGANWIKNEFDNLLNRIHGKVNTAKTAKVVNYDPIILDLDGDGFNIENKENGTHFDLDNNGFAEKINWTSKDGFLCLDLNGNGIIDNGGELFGDSTLLADGTKAKNGFEALAQYDSNGDSVIDKNDEIFESLRIWVDADGSGTSSEGEMKTLSELGISGIKLNYTVLNGETGTEAVLGNMATFIREDGTEGSAAELWVSSDLFDTTETLNVEISEEIAKLPDVRSIGNAHSLRTAMALDETGTLKGYVEEFVNSNNAAEKRQAVEKILYFICGAENIDSASRGGNMDARQLAVLETMLGENFTGVNGADPNTVAAPILKEAYNNLFNLYFTELIKETVLKEYLPLIRYSEDENGNKVINTELFDLVMDYTGRKNEETAAHIIGAASLYIDSLKASGYTYTGNFVEDYMKKSSTIAIGILGYTGMGLVADGENPLNGTASGEYLGGSVNNDEINAGEGDDILIGGKGDDILNGGKGCDTYVFNIGDGNDVVYDSHTYYYDARNDRIKFGEGITADSVNVRREDNSLIFEYGNGDMVTVKDHFASEYNSIEYVEFSNGDIITNNQIDKLIQAMASFEADSGMTWNEAIENNDKRASDIITEMWIKTA